MGTPGVGSSISLSQVQTEFGGANPIGMSEYYRNGLYVTPNNTGVPTTGTIGMSSLRGIYKTPTIAALSAAIASTPFADYRNKLFSRQVITTGFETNTGVAYHLIGDMSPVGATTITGSLTFSSSWVAGASPFLKVSYLTIILVNYGVYAGLASLTVNGVARTMTPLATGELHNVASAYYLGLNYVQIPVTTESFLSGMVASATYTKGSSNRYSKQELLVFPGRWNPVANVGSATWQTGQAVGTSAPNDILMGVTGADLDTNENSLGVFIGGTNTEFMRRSGQWYTNCCTHLSRVVTGAALLYDNGGYDPGGDNSAIIRGHRAVIWRCSEP